MLSRRMSEVGRRAKLLLVVRAWRIRAESTFVSRMTIINQRKPI